MALTCPKLGNPIWEIPKIRGLNIDPQIGGKNAYNLCAYYMNMHTHIYTYTHSVGPGQAAFLSVAAPRETPMGLE